MRTGACTIQQALTAEAATVLKLSLNLARRRGHAQVTPLHVAATLLTSSASSSSSSSSSSSPFPSSNLLRRACLKSHPHHPASHPLQCRALELCFNFLKPSSEPNNPANHHYLSQSEDLRLLLEVLVRKQGRRRRRSVVVVGDSAPTNESLVSELMRRVERGDVPNELKPCCFIKFQLSYLHLRLMSRGDVDTKVSELKRKVLSSSALVEKGGSGGGGCVIIYVGDLRWVVDGEAKDGEWGGVEYMVEEVGRMLGEVNNGSPNNVPSNRVWVLATSCYSTYMRCQMRKHSLEAQWALQAVMVPSGGLALSLQAPTSGLDSRVTKIAQYPFQMLEPQAFSPSKEEEDKLTCCVECSSNYEKEASSYSPEAKSTNFASTTLPLWLQPLNKDNLVELRRKWNRLCQRIHHGQNNRIHPLPSLFNQGLTGKSFAAYASSHPWRRLGDSQNKQNKPFTEPCLLSFDNTQEVGLSSLKKPENQEVKTALVLGTPLFSDSATSLEANKRGGIGDLRELERRLKENIFWQLGAVSSIVEALVDCDAGERKGTWFLMRGNDRVAKRRAAMVIAESWCGSIDGLVCVNVRESARRGSSCSEILSEALKKDEKCVILIEGIDRADTNFANSLVDGLKIGSFVDPLGRELALSNSIIILATSSGEEQESNVLAMRMWVEEQLPVGDLKRKAPTELPNKSKKPRIEKNGFDLNVCFEEEDDDEGNGEKANEGVNEEEEDAVPSDLTHEGGDTTNTNLPHGILESVAASFTFEAGPDSFRLISDHIVSKLNQAFDRTGDRANGLHVEETVVEGMVRASGYFLESLYERWVREVFQTGLATVKKGGEGGVRLGFEGKEVNSGELGFQGSVLPSRIHVD
ncbi:Chaperone protein ClpB [Ananas comosus]|uniref:Chaperone protein ClpB n=1 Tax=Ananas comosus TaxID=4615 RepID=A0A199W276_ANACO|nr:Chaperone protein ClpB [Ananas comosus]